MKGKDDTNQNHLHDGERAVAGASHLQVGHVHVDQFARRAATPARVLPQRLRLYLRVADDARALTIE